MQDGFTPAYVASEQGNTEIVAVLLANKADINAASKVSSLKIFKYLTVIEDFEIAFFT